MTDSTVSPLAMITKRCGERFSHYFFSENGGDANLRARAAHEFLRVLDQTKAGHERATVVSDELDGRVGRVEGLCPCPEGSS